METPAPPCRHQPTARQVAAILAGSAPAWNELIAWLKQQGITCLWHSLAPKYEWSLLPVLGKRRILYLKPYEGYFRASFLLSDRAVAAARASSLPAEVLEQIAKARRYAEGTPVRLVIHSGEDLDPVRKLVAIKLQN